MCAPTVFTLHIQVEKIMQTTAIKYSLIIHYLDSKRSKRTIFCKVHYHAIISYSLIDSKHAM